ncbi:MAG: tetratricopeptide repeat protein [Actinobacteria bacterium]|nr:tetratricopeptide repeat protein [Actinomycetota bacterium]
MDRDDALAVLGMAEWAAKALERADAEPWLERLAAEDERIHAALKWFVLSEEPELALRMAVALFPYWRDRGLLAEGRRWLAEALEVYEVEEPSALRSKALTAAGILAFRQGDDEASERLQLESLDQARAAGDRGGEASALLGLARVAFRRGDHAGVRSHCEASLRIAEEVGDIEARALPLHLLAESARVQGEFGRARDLYEASLEVHRAIEDERMLGLELHNLAYVDIHDGLLDVALGRFRESLRIARRRGDVGQVAYCVLGVGIVAAEQGAWRRAAELLGKTRNLLDRSGETLDPAEAEESERVEAAARKALGDEAFEACRIAGETARLVDVMDRVMADLPRPAESPR